MQQPGLYLAIMKGSDLEASEPIYTSEDQSFVRLVLRLAARHLRRAADDAEPAPLRVVSSSDPVDRDGEVEL